MERKKDRIKKRITYSRKTAAIHSEIAAVFCSTNYCDIYYIPLYFHIKV
ncbi:MAG: hypothetical protein LBQ68_00475 [Clostridiales bacterium]|nr:hypothetical protein [Clostridiales bacterium]